MGGSQHLAALRFLQKAGLDPDKDITVVIGGDVPAQLQSLVSGVIQLAALSPPTVILARDKFKLRIHGSTLDDLPNLQNGLAFSEKLLRERRDLAKRICAPAPARTAIFGKTNAARRKSWQSI